MNKNQTPPNNDPVAVPESELKMPNSQTSPEESHAHLGVILGVLIVILLLILGGLYLWGTTLTQPTEEASPERPTAEENNEPESTNAEAEVQTTQAVSTSDEIEAIEADVEATNLEELDAELEAIEAEFDAAMQAS